MGKKIFKTLKEAAEYLYFTETDGNNNVQFLYTNPLFTLDMGGVSLFYHKWFR